MVRVKILLFATLREKYGVKEVEVESEDGELRSVIEEAARRLGDEFVGEVYDENGEYREDRIIFINGRHIQFVKSTVLKDGDRVSIFPRIAGG